MAASILEQENRIVNNRNQQEKTMKSYPEGLVKLFSDPRAVGLNAAWVVRLLNTQFEVQPVTVDDYLREYSRLREQARREAFLV